MNRKKNVLDITASPLIISVRSYDMVSDGINYDIIFIEEGNRWIPKEGCEIIDYYESEGYLKDLTGAFEILFDYESNVNEKIEGHLMQNPNDSMIQVMRIF